MILCISVIFHKLKTILSSSKTRYIEELEAADHLRKEEIRSHSNRLLIKCL